MATVPQKPNALATSGRPKPKHHPRDSVREVVETIVFVVALVLMLKLFVVEAFVIPTGSMAETLLGYNKVAVCPDCGHEFPVNATDEVEPANGKPEFVHAATCPNCRANFAMKAANNPSPRSGDRVLVHKALYQVDEFDRGHVVVFKFPVYPQIKYTAQNYIKRLWGLGDETLAIYRGDLYVCRSLRYPEGELDENSSPKFPRPGPGQTEHLWEGPAIDRPDPTMPPYESHGQDFTYHNADLALRTFDESRKAGFTDPNGFQLIRKPDDLCLSMRRIVYDNDHQSKVLARNGIPPRWTADSAGWTPNDPGTPTVFTHSGDQLDWVRYAHRVPGEPTPVDGVVDEFGQHPLRDDWWKLANGWTNGLFQPSTVTNFLGYNSGEGGRFRETGKHWVGDLMVECEAKVSGPADEVVLELAQGKHRYRARFKDGAVALVHVGSHGERATRPTPITAGGTYRLRFANFDSRLRVWVDGRPIDFGGEADFTPWNTNGDPSELGSLAPVAAVTGTAFTSPQPDGHTVPNDVLAPVSIGAAGAVEVSRVALWMDTFFTPAQNTGYTEKYNDPDNPVDTFYVQPGHYFCLGDNSGHSSDSRKWGLVPDRLMLGRAVFVFFPIDRIGFIR